jgi:hypothetical protein
VPIPRMYRSRRPSALDDATRRLAAIQSEIASILAMFPELGRDMTHRAERGHGMRTLRRAPARSRHPVS